MDLANIADDLKFNHRGHFYSVVLREVASDRWEWTYRLEDVEVSSRGAPIAGEARAMARATASAEMHIDNMLMKRLRPGPLPC